MEQQEEIKEIFTFLKKSFEEVNDLKSLKETMLEKGYKLSLDILKKNDLDKEMFKDEETYNKILNNMPSIYYLKVVKDK